VRSFDFRSGKKSQPERVEGEKRERRKQRLGHDRGGISDFASRKDAEKYRLQKEEKRGILHRYIKKKGGGGVALGFQPVKGKPERGGKKKKERKKRRLTTLLSGGEEKKGGGGKIPISPSFTEMEPWGEKKEKKGESSHSLKESLKEKREGGKAVLSGFGEGRRNKAVADSAQCDQGTGQRKK